jgi:hypothetical protein
MKRILLLLMLCAGMLEGQAQTAASYLFATNNSTPLDPLVTPTTLFGINVDDQASPVTNIGFNFVFCGTSYNTFSVSSNGNVTLGGPATTTFSNNFPTGINYPVLMPFWDDLYTAGNGIRYEVKGTAPNRKLIVEWEVTNCCVGGIPDKKFQLWLFETSNYIQFVYDFGANINSATIGIANNAGDYHNVTSSTHTTSTNTINNTNNVWPGASRSYQFYLAAYDPAITQVTTPSGNCYTANQILTAQVCNLGSNPIDLSVNPATVTLTLNGPNGLQTFNQTISTGLLAPFSGSCVNFIYTGINMFAGGTYLVNASVSIPGVGNANTLNDSLPTPITKINFRPTAGPPYQLCQFSSIPFGQGLTVSGCATPIYDSATITFNLTPTVDNVGSTSGGTSVGPPANCADQYAGPFGNGILPALPAGASFTQPAVLTVTNLATVGSSFVSEARFNLYGASPTGPSLFSPGAAGGVGTTNPNFTYTRQVPAAQVGNAYSALGPLGTLNLGYWESYNDVVPGSDITLNAGGGTTVATLKIYYQYVPASFAWFNVPSGGTNLYNFSPFNPIITTGSGITNSNVTGTYTFFAACSASPNCRIPVNLVINPTPASFQDTLGACEYAVSSNSAIFDLSTLNSSVSGGNPLATVSYYFDEPLMAQITNVTNDTSSTNFIYSKVEYAGTGCYSSDTVLLQVFGQPELITSNGFACAPNAIDVSTLINPFSTSPAGTDTLYYSDPGYSVPFPNPNNVTVADTVYVVFATNTNPVCADSGLMYVDIIPANNFISGQVTGLNYSNPGTYSCMSGVFADGMSDTIRSTVDCRRVAAITDVANSTSLGTVSACLDIAASTPFHNGQPYLNRSVQVTAQTSDTAQVCLYFLDQDFQDYNADAAFFGWPLLPVAATMPLNMGNIALTKVDNGDLNTPGHVATAIGNAQINASYDPATTVWTVCFPVSGFSYFYLHTQNPGNVPLPVTLLNFNGRRENSTSVLNWTTLTEQGNSHFVVERSRDGMQFSRLSGNVLSKAPGGNSQTALNYGYTDGSPFAGHNYYRLQQADLDGRISYSKVVDVYFGNESIVTVYPNPASSQLNVDVQTPAATTAELSLSDATGRTVRVLQVKLQAGTNTVQMDIQDLADGVYMLRLSNGKGLEYSQKVNKN